MMRKSPFQSKRGFTLVELMIVVAIIGVLAALAIYGVTKYLSNAKTAEARTAIGRIAKDAASAFERETMPSGIITPGESAAIGRALCPAAEATVPAELTSVAGKKYQSTPADWSDDAGWSCLRFSMQGPQYFLYDYNVDGVTFEAVAQGDLDADTVPSSFKIEGAVVGEDGEEKTVNLAPSITEENPEE